MKTTHKISVMQLVLAFLCGLVLAFHRSGGAAGGWELFLVGAAAFLVLFLCGMGAENLRKKLLLKPAEPGKLGFAMLTLAGFLFAAAAVLFLLQREASATLRIITAVFCAFCGIATLLRLSLRDSGKTAAIYSLVPVFFLSYFLLMFYRSNGDNPDLLRFGYEVAVILITLLGIYAAVAGRFEKARPRFRSICCSAALCFLTQELGALLLMPRTVLSIPGFSAAALVMLLAFGGLLCYGLFYPPQREVYEEEPEAPQGDGQSDPNTGPTEA